MYQDFLELINKYRGHHNLEPTTFEDSEIGLEIVRFGTLPPSYVEFLKSCPTGSFFDDSFIIYDGPLSFEDLSLEIRTEDEDGLVAFGDNFGGTILCFDTESPNDKGEFPIVEYNYPDYRVQVAADFREWLMGMVGVFA